jgi:anthranilate phosphoribosyltransferase
LGIRRALVVHGAGGLDEISLAGPTEVAEADGESVRTYRVSPEDFGLERCAIEVLQVADAVASARCIRDVLRGTAGPHADVVTLNAGAALYAAEAASSIAVGIDAARAAIRSGRALTVLERLIAFTRT